jgi:hypothetical protein
MYIAIVSILHIGDLFMAFQKRLKYEALDGDGSVDGSQNRTLINAISGKLLFKFRTIQKILRKLKLK